MCVCVCVWREQVKMGESGGCIEWIGRDSGNEGVRV